MKGVFHAWCIVGLCLVVPLGARADEQTLIDAIQTVQARRTLSSDPQLQNLDLGVRVRKGVAMLWGPVASPDVAFRAEQKLRSVPEIREVRNYLVVMNEDFLFQPVFEPAQPPAPAIPGLEFRPATASQTSLGGRATPSLPSLTIPVPQESLRIPLEIEP